LKFNVAPGCIVDFFDNSAVSSRWTFPASRLDPASNESVDPISSIFQSLVFQSAHVISAISFRARFIIPYTSLSAISTVWSFDQKIDPNH
jgi:hypothetical protein